MPLTGRPSLAFVQDAISVPGGAEQVLAAALEAFPGATLHALVRPQGRLDSTILDRYHVHTSFVDRLPGARTRHRAYLPLLPLAIEHLDLDAHDIIVSFSYAVAHGVLARPDQLHLSYTYTPLRYAWQQRHGFLRGRRAPIRWAAAVVLHYLRLWDLAAARRVDHFVAPSHWIARWIWRAYRRRAEVIYPPVDVDRFQPLEPRDDYYVTVARLQPHKQVSIVVDAFTRLGYPLLVVGRGAEEKRLARRAGPAVQLLGHLSPDRLAGVLGRARALVHATEEDFGIAPLEAQAAGCPVIAYGRGGLRETVVEGRTGYFFERQTVESVMETVREFEASGRRFRAEDLVRNARRFSKERFHRAFSAMVDRQWTRFARQGRPAGHPESAGAEGP